MRITTSSLVTILILPLMLLLSGCSLGATAEPAAQTLAMGFVPNVQFAPFYVAVEKGFFADEGIEVEFDYGWETDLLKLVGTDEIQFAIASGDQVLLARGQGLPAVYIMNWYRRFPVCVVSLSGSGIQDGGDLAGKQVGTPATYGASYIGWRALLDAVGLAETDVELISIGYTQPAALSEGQVDAALCYAMNEPVQMQAVGQEVDIIYVADYANLVSNGLITNERTVADRPELARGMVRAALRGLTYTIEHPDEAFEITLAHVPEASGEAEAVNRAILAKSIEFWLAEPGQLGLSNEDDWRASLDIMRDMGLVEAGDDALRDAFSNEFVGELEP